MRSMSFISEFEKQVLEDFRCK